MGTVLNRFNDAQDAEQRTAYIKYHVQRLGDGHRVMRARAVWSASGDWQVPDVHPFDTSVHASNREGGDATCRSWLNWLESESREAYRRRKGRTYRTSWYLDARVPDSAVCGLSGEKTIREHLIHLISQAETYVDFELGYQESASLAPPDHRCVAPPRDRDNRTGYCNQFELMVVGDRDPSSYRKRLKARADAAQRSLSDGSGRE